MTLSAWPVDGEGARRCEEVSLEALAREIGTPYYVYSKRLIDDNCHRLKAAFSSYPTLPCYAIKANGNLSLLDLIASHGFGLDAVSRGELERALQTTVSPDKMLLSGVGKTDEEIQRGLEVGVLAIGVESLGELSRIADIARRSERPARVSLRINPNISVETNPHIATGLHSTKFGIAEDDVEAALSLLRQNGNLQLVGLSCHLGSQILDLKPFAKAAARMATLALTVRSLRFPLRFLSLGGGLGIRYRDEIPPSVEAYADTLLTAIAPTEIPLVLEPGRWLIGNAGALVTRVTTVKKTPAKTFVVVDAAMNDLIRPCLYSAYHAIEAIRPQSAATQTVDVVGPVCETADFLGRDRALPVVHEGDLLAVRDCGAYGASMASNYNGRPRAPEILVDGHRHRTVRRRERLADLWAEEIP